MLSVEEIKKYLKLNLKESRYNHVIGVCETSIKLSKLNGVSIEKAEIAALVHDVAKNLDKDHMIKIINQNNIKLSYVEKENTNLWHSIIAPILAKEKFGITDKEILEAIRWHTTGKEDMSPLVKIVYIADMIEPGRSFHGVEEIRKETFENLDKGVYLGLTHSIQYLLEKNLLIDENTIKARNYFLFK